MKNYTINETIPVKCLIYLATILLLFIFQSSSAKAMISSTVTTETTQAISGTTFDITIDGPEAAFNSNTTALEFSCGDMGGDSPDIVTNSINVISPNQLVANVTVNPVTTCLSDQDYKTRINKLLVYENDPENGVFVYNSDIQINIKNASIEISPDSPNGLTTINQGIADALEGDTILVSDGEYHETVDLNKNNIVLKSKNGYTSTSIINDYCDSANGGVYTVTMGSGASTSIEGFNLPINGQEGCINNGIFINGETQHTIKNMKFSPGLAIGIGLAGTNNNIITENLFQNNNYSLYFMDSVSTTTVSRNSFIGNTAGIYNLAVTPDFSNDFSFNYWGDPSGPLSINLNPRGTGDAIPSTMFFGNWYADDTFENINNVQVESSNINNFFIDASAYASNLFLRTPDGLDPTNTPSLTSIQRIILSVATPGASSTVTIPNGTTFSRVDENTFDASLLSNTVIDTENLSGFTNSNIIGHAMQWGLPNIGLVFSQPINISLYVGSDYEGRTVNILHSNSTSSDWNTEGLSAATCVVISGFCNFTTTRASYFATTLTQNSNSSGGGGAVILPPQKKLEPIEKGTSTDTISKDGNLEQMPTIIKQPAKATNVNTTTKKVLGIKIKYVPNLVRDISNKKIYEITSNNKTIIRTIKELRQKYSGIKIYDLPHELLNQWKDK